MKNYKIEIKPKLGVTVGYLIFWEIRTPKGGYFAPIRIEMEFKPNFWQLFKLWLVGIKWKSK